MTQKVYDTAVIGAGASGLMAAITAARSGANVLVLEHMPLAGKKILATGNGRCNYTNRNLELSNYYCEDSDFVREVLEQFSLEHTIRFFENLGVRPIQKNGTCIYPESEQASSIRTVLLDECERLSTALCYKALIQKIVKKDHLFYIHTKQKVYVSRTCILATGGKSSPKSGSDGSGYELAQKLGHRIQMPLPALAALEADFSKYRLPSGVRIGCQASILVDSIVQETELGELQITEYGLSGIVIFQISRIAARALAGQKKVLVELDFKPQETTEAFAEYLEARFSSPELSKKTLKRAMTGLVPEKLIPVLLQKAGIREKGYWNHCTPIQKKQLNTALKCFRVKITGIKQFDQAQTTTGGIDVFEISAATMESKIVPNLFFAGEIMDVDGKCGGYNLQWSWATGHLAGKSAAWASKKKPRGKM